MSGDAKPERLQKILARAGYGSRRVCEELIDSGRVFVNGSRAILGTRANAETDLITVDGAPVAAASHLVYYLLQKPAKVVTTMYDPEGRKTVADFVPSEPRVFPVGRLDYDSEGLLLLTNDGELTHRLTHPSFGVEKEYLVAVEGKPNASALSQLRNGVALEDGKTSPARIGVLGEGQLRITIHEGRNRQVRRMCEAVGHPVKQLVRTRIGPLTDARLNPGEWRELSLAERRALAEATVKRPSGQRRTSNNKGETSK